MDFEDIPEADESPVIVQGEESQYFYEENPLTQAPAETVEEETYYYEEAPAVTQQMPPPVPQQDIWNMPEPEADDALTYVNILLCCCKQSGICYSSPLV